MVKSDQIKALIRSFAEGDADRFYRVALQVAADEARRGHTTVAKELREAIDSSREHSLTNPPTKPVPLVRAPAELDEVVTVSYPSVRLGGMVLAEDTEQSLERLLAEHRQRARLEKYALQPRRKLLLVGPPGTGKTMTARVLAAELKLPLFEVRLESLITKYMGATAAKLRIVFDAMKRQRGVYLFDEFDSLGPERSAANDVGEIRRVVNSFLQFLEADDSDSIIVAATNHPQLLDRALFRRFDDIVRYEMPDEAQCAALIDNTLSEFVLHASTLKEASASAIGLSHADVTSASRDAAKVVVLAGGNTIDSEVLSAAFERRKRRTER